ncbi:type II toxin-antitoxin system mRNA interferase toxin, RelE/StbE family [Pollutimonas nitritireducens]|uniref:Type II toxin-antitoxin system mRNA interferase toxin, RelE/StbE family n=1 Tax=Pollutimonas nitritireducens TaxID=2045209 RepID=A0A2N4UBL7_9BURK|nr:type II toxin-antitoxin system RelE/ParE family toxin [Pollutimonas nitritireducens]PLC52414.1 type II toxin-antitoxin system mRNA interferase toxin, RelE/StbE family [Pollutimonas nitritireducens]
MLTITWLSTAKRDLAEIITYIAERSPQAARNIRRHIESALLPVAEHPYLYKPGRISGTREIVAHPNYIIVYKVTYSAIEVMNVVHARQEYP